MIKNYAIVAPLRVEIVLSLNKNMQEICICAAIKMPDGYIVRGHRHNDCFHTIKGIAKWKNVPDGFYDRLDQGFMTTENRFVDRFEGRELQVKAKIKPFRNGEFLHHYELFSEDLY